MSRNDNQRIAENAIFLYFRMMLIMFVSLYTSRVTLEVLGVDDFGIYQTVGGVVTLLSFISNALGAGTSRFITFEMGKKDSKLDELFSTVRIAHIILGICIVAVAEVLGIWFINNKLVIPAERMSAAIFAFHLSVITTFFKITQVPYNAIIIAYERMNIYASVSILEAALNLGIVYALQIINYDKLEVYSVLFALVTVIIMIIYRVYCRKAFNEIKGRLRFEKNMFKAVLSFSSWSLLTSSAASIANQGVTIVTNMFFSPAVVTVRTLALRVSSALNQFITSFRTAVNPQIVKKYAANDIDGSKKLSIESTKCTFYLIFLIVLPIYLLVEPVLHIWLGKVPEGAVVFVEIALIQSLFQSFDTSLYAPIYAKGQIKENAIISPLCDFLQLPIIFILFKLGSEPIVLAWVELLACIVLGVVIKPVLVHRIVNFSYGEVYAAILRCFVVAGIAAVAPYWTSKNININSILGFLVVLMVSLISVSITVWIIGVDKNTKLMLFKWVRNRNGNGK